MRAAAEARGLATLDYTDVGEFDFSDPDAYGSVGGVTSNPVQVDVNTVNYPGGDECPECHMGGGEHAPGCSYGGDPGGY